MESDFAPFSVSVLLHHRRLGGSNDAVKEPDPDTPVPVAVSSSTQQQPASSVVSESTLANIWSRDRHAHPVELSTPFSSLWKDMTIEERAGAYKTIAEKWPIRAQWWLMHGSVAVVPCLSVFSSEIYIRYLRRSIYKMRDWKWQLTLHGFGDLLAMTLGLLAANANRINRIAATDQPDRLQRFPFGQIARDLPVELLTNVFFATLVPYSAIPFFAAACSRNAPPAPSHLPESFADVRHELRRLRNISMSPLAKFVRARSFRFLLLGHCAAAVYTVCAPYYCLRKATFLLDADKELFNEVVEAHSAFEQTEKKYTEFSTGTSLNL